MRRRRNNAAATAAAATAGRVRPSIRWVDGRSNGRTDGQHSSGGGALSSRSLSHTTEPQHNLRDLLGSKSTPSPDRLFPLLSRSTDTQSSLCGGNEKGEEGARLHSNACLSDERGRHGKGQGREGGSPIRLTDRPRPSHRTDRRTDGCCFFCCRLSPPSPASNRALVLLLD